jgi:hypothetical protein
MTAATNLNKSLQELENSNWGEPDTAETLMIKNCLQLRRVPINQLTADDLRLLIGQAMSLPILVPVCLAQLQEDPLLEATYYPGDLLESLLRIELPFWESSPENLQTLQERITQAKNSTNSHDEETLKVLNLANDFVE